MLLVVSSASPPIQLTAAAAFLQLDAIFGLSLRLRQRSPKRGYPSARQRIGRAGAPPAPRAAREQDDGRPSVRRSGATGPRPSPLPRPPARRQPPTPALFLPRAASCCSSEGRHGDGRWRSGTPPPGPGGGHPAVPTCAGANGPRL